MIYSIKKVKVPIYGGVLLIAIADTYDVYSAAKDIFKVDDVELKGYEAVTLRGKNFLPREYMIVFSRNVTPGLIAHESKHTLNNIYKDVDAKLDIDNDEPECYFLSWIVNRVWEVKMDFDKKIKDEEKCRINELRAQNESNSLRE